VSWRHFVHLLPFSETDKVAALHTERTLSSKVSRSKPSPRRAPMLVSRVSSSPSLPTMLTSPRPSSITAIVHYSPSTSSSDIVRKDQIYLCDSGAQYLDGTTDVTRTLHFGTPTAEEIRAFTRVLQGHIAIETAVFPCGTTGESDSGRGKRNTRREGWERKLELTLSLGFRCSHTSSGYLLLVLLRFYLLSRLIQRTYWLFSFVLAFVLQRRFRSSTSLGGWPRLSTWYVPRSSFHSDLLPSTHLI